MDSDGAGDRSEIRHNVRSKPILLFLFILNSACHVTGMTKMCWNFKAGSFNTTTIRNSIPGHTASNANGTGGKSLETDVNYDKTSLYWQFIVIIIETRPASESGSCLS